jgi:hypothetical protein
MHVEVARHVPHQLPVPHRRPRREPAAVHHHVHPLGAALRVRQQRQNPALHRAVHGAHQLAVPLRLHQLGCPAQANEEDGAARGVGAAEAHQPLPPPQFPRTHEAATKVVGRAGGEGRYEKAMRAGALSSWDPRHQVHEAAGRATKEVPPPRPSHHPSKGRLRTTPIRTILYHPCCAHAHAHPANSLLVVHPLHRVHYVPYSRLYRSSPSPRIFCRKQATPPRIAQQLRICSVVEARGQEHAALVHYALHLEHLRGVGSGPLSVGLRRLCGQCSLRGGAFQQAHCSREKGECGYAYGGKRGPYERADMEVSESHMSRCMYANAPCSD